MIKPNGGLAPDKPDAAFDLDGTVFKMTVLEVYTAWLSEQGIFDPLPRDLIDAKRAWKNENTEESYTNHLGLLVQFFIKQVPGKRVEQLTSAAQLVADQQKHRRWNITTGIIEHLRPTHNVIAISLMPEWLMGPFARDLGFVELIGSTYVARGGPFTEEAHTINKATAYAELRGGDTSKLDIHMGDTVGDVSLFALARRPILFNPSWTLATQTAPETPTILTSHKDMVQVINLGQAAQIWGAPFDIETILAEISSKW